MSRYGDTTAILPTGTNINLHEPQANEYYNEDLTYYVMADAVNPRKMRVWSSYGHCMNIGAVRSSHHDQTLRYTGTYKVIGFITPGADPAFAAQGPVGFIPNRKLPLGVFK
jgi:hypothetical protein